MVQSHVAWSENGRLTAKLNRFFVDGNKSYIDVEYNEMIFNLI